jgi:hypothetical protein
MRPARADRALLGLKRVSAAWQARPLACSRGRVSLARIAINCRPGAPHSIPNRDRVSQVHLCDPVSGRLLTRLYPLDKTRNADGQRALKVPLLQASDCASAPGMAPLLQKILREYATTGLPPAYLPKDDIPL